MNKEKEILMNYTIYDYLGLFFLYAFLGWLLETSVAAIRIASPAPMPRCITNTPAGRFSLIAATC